MLIKDRSGGVMTIEEGRKSPTYANMKMLGFTEVQSSVSSPEELYAEFHTNMSQFREPPPYPGPPKHNNQPGLRQSFSGSEASTDVSVSSTENLASCQRQEPQGEETSLPVTCVSLDTGSDYSILARLGMPTSALEAGSNLEPTTSAAPPHIYVTGNSGGHGPHFATSPAPTCTHGRATTPNFYVSSESGFSSASTSSSKLTVLDHSNPPVSLFNHMLITDGSPSVSSKQSVSNFSSPTSVSSYNSSTLYANYPTWQQLSGMEGSPGPGVVQYSAVPGGGQMLPHYISSLPPPPDYPGIHNQDFDRPEVARRSYEIIGRTDFPGSRSQPDLTHFWDAQRHRGTLHTGANGSDRGSQHSIENLQEPRLSDTSIDHIAAQATRMVEVLTDENKGLREKLAVYDRKVSKLQKFELEIQKVNEGYEALVKSSKKREYLEVVMRRRLEEEITSVKAVNRGLIRQLEAAGLSVPDPVILASTDPTDSSMAALLAKHKELLSVKERQDMELEALQATVEQQRAQIDILRSVQANTRMDEETQRQQIIAEYDEEIQKELASIKAVYEKKEQTERNIREKLERDVQQCRQHHVPLPQGGAQGGAASGGAGGRKDLNAAEIKRMLDEKEAKILQLEKELITWKEQHLEESIRKLKLQEAADSSAESTPRLPSYEQAGAGPTMSTETLINEAKAEKLKQVEEIYQANKRMAELEATVKSLQSAVSEKDAMLRVYQRSPMTRSSSVHTIYCTPHHSPRPSLTASMTGSLSRQSSQEAATLLRHKKTGSTSALETATTRASQDDLFEKIQALQKQSKSTSDTEEGSGNIWQV